MVTPISSSRPYRLGVDLTKSGHSELKYAAEHIGIASNQAYRPSQATPIPAGTRAQYERATHGQIVRPRTSFASETPGYEQLSDQADVELIAHDEVGTYKATQPGYSVAAQRLPSVHDAERLLCHSDLSDAMSRDPSRQEFSIEDEIDGLDAFDIELLDFDGSHPDAGPNHFIHTAQSTAHLAAQEFSQWASTTCMDIANPSVGRGDDQDANFGEVGRLCKDVGNNSGLLKPSLNSAEIDNEFLGFSKPRFSY